MLENLKEFMRTNHHYELTDYAYFDTTYRRTNWLPLSLSLFVIVFLVFLLDLIFSWNVVNYVVLIIAFVVLVVLPLALKKGNKYQSIVVTPVYLIEQQSKDDFVAIDFDEITSFKLTDKGIRIESKQKKIMLGLNLSREEIDQIIDILEAKGKTFEPEKDYMIRPVEIIIKDNHIRLRDISVRTDLDDLYEQFSNKYMMLTPGFIDYIIFRNSNVKKVEVLNDQQCFALHIDRFEVKEGHPENTKFDSIDAMDCIAIFQKVEIESMILQNTHDANVPDKKCDRTLDTLPEFLENAVIAEWKITKSRAIFFFATGVHQLKMTFSYSDVIIGWNKTKE
ncbi:hypothetical protein [Candidatus Xianfuyuplasma coldseepsis]|uniref:Uncharacterized protein n=1 Tax=Candidatus Xianfuyuplasma coldseepsis TaxID=2782163 RepID=A0A7L7KPU3_9MOLU|nr:hypothetical protein [Xianfuyuplasma coldseepsis]QMS84196.1 hypothetical protein G4Z02_00045 [Xianfuyuplasma coldseepsis]